MGAGGASAEEQASPVFYDIAPTGRLTVNIQNIQPLFSIYTYGSQTTAMYFHEVSDLKLENGGASFTHRGKRKYISGNFWIEPMDLPRTK